jgi:hypothetical protein
MAIRNSSMDSLDRSPTGPVEQLLVMHCLKEDSVLRRVGFSVRAASAGAKDTTTLEWAEKLSPYELPLNMKGSTLLPDQAPRRLSLLRDPQGRFALVHSCYLPEDTCGRGNSYISHVLLPRDLGVREAITAWGSPVWLTDYRQGETKELRTLDHIPCGDLINDGALTSFLSGGSAPKDQMLARSIYPFRVESKPDARRCWLRAALHEFLRTGEVNATRKRVFILAEPGAVALLIYAIARLLPHQLADTFLFSTYEPPQSLRENRVDGVIGSYARDGLDPADSDVVQRKGYVVDTFHDAYEPELMVERSWPLEGLLDLVASGDWKGVKEVHELWERDSLVVKGATLETLGEAVWIRPLIGELRDGKLEVGDLIKLRSAPLGDMLLHDHAELRYRAWEVVRKVWRHRDIRKRFEDLLSEHHPDLLDDVCRALPSAHDSAWREDWESLEPLVPADHRGGLA